MIFEPIRDLFRPVLSDRQILKYYAKGLLITTEISPEQVQPNSIDLTLSNSVKVLTNNRHWEQEMRKFDDVKTRGNESSEISRVMDNIALVHYLAPEQENRIEGKMIDTCEPVKYEQHSFMMDAKADGSKPSYILNPGEFALMSSRETLHIPNGIISFVQGRSSIARIGIQTEQAGLIDAGFHGAITFEVYNQTRFPIILYEGMRVAQVYFFKASYAKHLYGSVLSNSKYQYQHGATGSMIHKDLS